MLRMMAGQVALWSAVGTAAAQAPVTLNVDVQQIKAKVSPMLYGLMTEEINFSYDGGLYGELIRNRTFQDKAGETPHWTATGAGVEMAVDTTTGPSTALPLSLKVTAAQAGGGVTNDGFWGIPVRPHTAYHGSFYARAAPGAGAVTVSVVNDATSKSMKATVPKLSTEWKRYEFTLTSGAESASAANHFTLGLDRPGTVWITLVSLFPPTFHNRANGNRPDLMEKMAAMQPAFLRFPGGNYLEGDHIPERFEWKKTIGPLVDRPTHISPWRYHSSDGMGLLEFLNWCEDLHMQPLLAVYAGYSMKQEFVKPGPDLDPYVADALDEIEYVTGSVKTKWGAERARNGHPAPFALQYVEIGNEDFFDKSKSYEGRYAQFYKAIKVKYPALQLIATMPIKEMKADVVDDHFYRKAAQFFNDVHHYDATDRNGPKIFVGEWATREGAPTPNFNAALGDAAWMTGMERNSDLVIMAAYAPLLVNVNPGGMQWPTDLIGYDAMTSYGSPSYYAQVLFRKYLGDQVVDASLSGADPLLFSSVTRASMGGTVYVKLVNAGAEARTVTVNLKGLTDASAKMVRLSAAGPTETNTIADPVKIVPVESSLGKVGATFEHVLPPYAIDVLELAPGR